MPRRPATFSALAALTSRCVRNKSEHDPFHDAGPKEAAFAPKLTGTRADKATLESTTYGAAGELRLSAGLLLGDTNGNGIADFEIKVTGIGAGANSDFVL